MTIISVWSKHRCWWWCLVLPLIKNFPMLPLLLLSSLLLWLSSEVSKLLLLLWLLVIIVVVEEEESSYRLIFKCFNNPITSRRLRRLLPLFGGPLPYWQLLLLLLLLLLLVFLVVMSSLIASDKETFCKYDRRDCLRRAFMRMGRWPLSLFFAVLLFVVVIFVASSVVMMFKWWHGVIIAATIRVKICTLF